MEQTFSKFEHVIPSVTEETLNQQIEEEAKMFKKIIKPEENVLLKIVPKIIENIDQNKKELDSLFDYTDEITDSFNTHSTETNNNIYGLSNKLDKEVQLLKLEIIQNDSHHLKMNDVILEKTQLNNMLINAQSELFTKIGDTMEIMSNNNKKLEKDNKMLNVKVDFLLHQNKLLLQRLNKLEDKCKNIK